MNTFQYRHDPAQSMELVNGHYELGEPKHAVIDGHNILYSLGSALLDNSCCGSFGCTYALVIGELAAGEAGKAAPLMHEIDAEAPLAERIRTTLFEREAINVVNFYLPPLLTISGEKT